MQPSPCLRATRTRDVGERGSPRARCRVQRFSSVGRGQPLRQDSDGQTCHAPSPDARAQKAIGRSPCRSARPACRRAPSRSDRLLANCGASLSPILRFLVCTQRQKEALRDFVVHGVIIHRLRERARPRFVVDFIITFAGKPAPTRREQSADADDLVRLRRDATRVLQAPVDGELRVARAVGAVHRLHETMLEIERQARQSRAAAASPPSSS